VSESSMQPQAAAPRVAVVILTWNRVDEIVTCLESFSCVEYPNYEVIVVDNASQDDTAATVRAQFPWAELIVNDDNLGYVGGNNVGIRAALEKPEIEYVFILNNDTKMTPSVLSELVRVMQSDPRIAITGAKNLLMEDPAYTWGKYGKLTWGPLLVTTIGRHQPDCPEDYSPKDVDWVIGNGCMMSRAALERVGLFDESFFQVNEDVDWGMRARKLGYRRVYVDTAAIYHKGGSSADFSRPVVFSYGYFLGRNAIMFARKHANAWQWAKLVTLMTLGMVLRTAFYAGNAALRAILGQEHFVTGVVDGFSGRLRRDHITVRFAIPSRVPPNTPIMRFLRWLGA
jgi:GT2 family glycosyltransferase